MPFRAKSGRLDIGIGLDDSTDKNDDAVFLLFRFYHQNKWLPFHSLPLTIRTYTHTHLHLHKMLNDYDNSAHASHQICTDGMGIFLNKNDNIDDDDDKKKVQWME